MEFIWLTFFTSLLTSSYSFKGNVWLVRCQLRLCPEVNWRSWYNLSWSIHDVLLEDKVLMAAHLKWSQVCNTVQYADADYFLFIYINISQLWGLWFTTWTVCGISFPKKCCRLQFQVVAHFIDCVVHIFSTKVTFIFEGFGSLNGMVFLIILDQIGFLEVFWIDLTLICCSTGKTKQK